MAYIEFNDVIKAYGSGETLIHALDGASFSVERGQQGVGQGAVLRHPGEQAGQTVPLHQAEGRVGVGEPRPEGAQQDQPQAHQPPQSGSDPPRSSAQQGPQCQDSQYQPPGMAVPTVYQWKVSQ